ncbi:MAG: hypothetical protein NTX76_05570, partial [Alphaproteobacteria bacterium]|nr:hypothetical protein [Alphaproteobacteria bacterium]
MSKKPETIEMTEEERDALLKRIQDSTLSTEDRVLVNKCLNFMTWLQDQLQHSKISIDKLRKLFDVFPIPPEGNSEKKA